MITPVRRGTRAVPGPLGPHRSHGFRRIEASSSRRSPAEQLRTLARVVERLSLNGRFDPEAAFIERDELAHALRRLADRLEHQSGQPATAAPASISQAVLPRRFAAVLAAKASEIASLRALLAQAMRPGRRRRRSASVSQLMLPLSEGANER
jgi:hypothetical protein